jgi:cellulose synthase/poly-beta-1,6-N-acetylglucosamine synthase-like glycosyltransferase
MMPTMIAEAKTIGRRIRQFAAQALFGPYYTAIVRMDYDDRYGKDSLTTTLSPFRSRTRVGAACCAIRLAQKDSKDGWKSAHVESVQSV